MLVNKKLPSTQLNERNFFFSNLSSRPRFLILHVPFFIQALYVKVRNTFRIKAGTRHGGNKIWPPFLPFSESFFEKEECVNIKLNLPTLSFHPDSFCLDERVEASDSLDHDDPELYMKQNRWGHLFAKSLGKLEEVDAYISEWVSKHDDKENDLAWETYSCCERLSNLLIYLSASSSDSDCGELDSKSTVFLEESLSWIYQHLEYYGPRYTNNHFLNNARALVMGGVALDNRSAVDAGIKIFHECLPSMILSNGSLRERSSHYQLIILGWLLDTLLFMKIDSVIDEREVVFLQGYADKMISSSSRLCDDEGYCLAFIGDVSPDSSPKYTSKKLAELYWEYWPVPSDKSSRVDCWDDWFLLRDGNSVVIGNFPAGGFPFMHPTHGHGDFTSFSWIEKKRSVLVDLGRYSYDNDTTSMLQKSAGGHNLPLINGFSPVAESITPVGERFAVPYSKAKLAVKKGDFGISLRHDGFARATPVKFHERLLSLKNKCLKVSDSFTGVGNVGIDFLWYLDGDFSLGNKDVLLLEGKGRELQIKITDMETSEPICADSITVFTCGASFEYGKKESVLGLRLRFNVNLPASIQTSFKLDDLCVE